MQRLAGLRMSSKLVIVVGVAYALFVLWSQELLVLVAGRRIGWLIMYPFAPHAACIRFAWSRSSSRVRGSDGQIIAWPSWTVTA